MSALGSTPTRTRPSRADLDTALRDRLLATSWQLIDALERLEPAEANRAFAAQRQAEVERAQATLEPLTQWEGLSDSSYGTYVRGPNHVRVRRILDFVEPGERILDIGIGYGYLTGVLVRSGLPSYYCGIELTERRIEATKAGLKANGLDNNGTVESAVNQRVRELCARFPIYQG